MTPLTELLAIARATVTRAEVVSAQVKTPQAAKVLGAARVLLAEVEVLIEQEKR